MKTHTSLITHWPAECSANCDDPMCPYPHCETWEFDGKQYRTEVDAIAALTRAQGVTEGGE
jgi:hypothetical protein